MDKQEYIRNVSGQIRNRRARQLVVSELIAHIEDQEEALQREGLDKGAAEEAAVRQMGDPVSVGMEMDRLHRPQFPRAAVCLMAFFSLISIMVQYILIRDLSVGLSSSMFLKHVCYTLIGFTVMLGICAADYTILGKYGKILAVGFLILLGPVHSLFGYSVNGAARWLNLYFVNVNLSSAAFFYLPIFGGVLYAYRGRDRAFLWKILIWMTMPVVFLLHMSALSSVMILFLSEFLMLLVVIRRGWYRRYGRKTCRILTGSLAGAAAILILRFAFRAGYQGDRVRAWLGIGSGQAENYMGNLLRKIWSSCRLFGESAEAVKLLKGLPEVNMDFTLVGMTAGFGTGTVCIVLGLMAVFLFYLVRVVCRQKNQLGMIVGLGCILGIGLELLLNLAVMLTLFPLTGVTVPLLANSGSSTMVSFALIGFVLSIQHNQTLTRDPRTDEKKVNYRNFLFWT